MKIVKIVKDWQWPNLNRQSRDGSGRWSNYLFTENATDEYDYLVVLNRNPQDINLPKLNLPKFLVSQEPPFHVWHRRSFNYFDQVFTQHRSRFFRNITLSHGALPWYIGKSYRELVSLKPTALNKQKTISCIVSSQNKVIGHQRRLKFIRELSKSNLPIDYFGRGTNEIADKYDGLRPYKYSVAIENSTYPHYWTEKIADCFLSYTIPIYYGCTNISTYFPEGSFIWIDIEKPALALKTIQKQLDSDYWERNFASLCEARDLVLNRYQLLPFLVEKIENYCSRPRPLKHIPANLSPWEKEYSLKERVELKLLSYA